jgi:hypothetical protein
MPVPVFQSLTLPVLQLCGDQEEHKLTETIDWLADRFELSDAERDERLPSGSSRLYNRTCWAITYLAKAKLLQRLGPGRFTITEKGVSVLANPPATIDAEFLLSIAPEIDEFRRGGQRSSEEQANFDEETRLWIRRPDVEQRVQEKMERFVPDEAVRKDALTFLAFAIENANEERENAWYLKETRRGLRLITARVYACEIRRSHLRVSVVGPIGDDVRAQVGAEPEDDEEVFKSIPGGILLTIPIEHASIALEVLRDPFNLFVDMAMARVRRAVGMDDHTPEAVDYIGSVVGRMLPQPSPDVDVDTDGEDPTDGEATVSREPKVRGRAPIFEHGQRSIASLISDVERGAIALPELQRPFVWEDTKVRDLLDSLFLGFPVGTLVFWHTSSDKDARALGAERPELRANTLVIDGQQRLTSLFAVMKGIQVIGKEGEERRINIAFRPRDGRFEVTDAAIKKDPEFIPDITELWNGTRTKPQMRRELINGLRDKGREVDEKYEDAVDRNIDRAHSINDYRFPTVDIRKTASSEDEATEEDVAEIFVRINNQGTRLGQADFVLTLLAVFHGELRDRIETRAREMSAGSVVSVDTQQLLRAICGVAFGRARMAAVYRYLRGVDPVTGDADITGRVKRLEQLDAAADICLDMTKWRDFVLRVQRAGFVSPALIASKNAIVNAYAFYIRGRNAGVPRRDLEELVSRWVYATLVTARYSAASETIFEQDLARVMSIDGNESEGFISALDAAISEAVGGDYWERTFAAALETQKSRAPAALGFRAAQVVLGARALFSDQLLQTYLAPGAQAGRSASELHHLFPEAWLRSKGISDRRMINQVANLADVGWYDNSAIGSRGPAQYVPRIRERLNIDDSSWARMCSEHALPVGWEMMKYEEFLYERRRRMADIAHVAFRQLGGDADEGPLTPPWFLPGSEEVWKRIATTEVALRRLVRDVYASRFGDKAAEKITDTLSDSDRDALRRATRNNPSGLSTVGVIDYLYLGALPPLLFAPNVWDDVRTKIGATKEVKGKLELAIQQIAKVRNEIAHVREVSADQLMRASVACSDVMEIIRDKS